jgi:pimeloyl-ACP methyl ester carboxylesterase
MNNISPAALLRHFQLWKDIRIRAGWHLQSHVCSGLCRVVDAKGNVRLKGQGDDCRTLFETHAPPWGSDHAVLMLHSLAGSPAQLARLESYLNAAGYCTANAAYPNLFAGMDDHVRHITGLIESMAEDGIRHVSFVGHSYGGLLIRALWQESLPIKRGPVAFFGTPHRGSKLAAMLRPVPGYRAYFGDASQDVLADAVARLPIPDTPMLVVAGGLGRLGFNPLLGENNDGIVTVAETRLPGAAHDFVYLPGCLHRFLPRNHTGMAAALKHLESTRSLSSS